MSILQFIKKDLADKEQDEEEYRIPVISYTAISPELTPMLRKRSADDEQRRKYGIHTYDNDGVIL